MASYKLGFNFRATQGYVTDPLNTVGFFGTAYPTSKVFPSATVNAGWDGTVTATDRSTTVDSRLAGSNTLAQNAAARKFRVDLPVSGQWAIRLASGSLAFTRAVSFDILDSDGTTVLYSRTEVSLAPPQFIDATRVVRTSAADWVTNNALINLTFSGTAAYIRLNTSATYGNELNHISFAKNTAPQATITDVTVLRTSGTATLTVSLDVPAPVGGCSVDFGTQDGTGIATIDYISNSGTVTFAAGEQSKSITVSIIP